MKRIIESIKSLFRTKEQNRIIALNKETKQIQFDKLFTLLACSFNPRFTIDPSKPLYSDIENYRFYIKKENDKICISITDMNTNEIKGELGIKGMNTICVYGINPATSTTNFISFQHRDLKRLINKVVPKLI